MTPTGGSDGDGRGSRYEKDLAAAKIAEAKWRESKSGSSVGDAPGGGCLTGLGGCWLASIIITTLGILIIMIIRLGAMTVENIASNYSTAQYFRNSGHMDRAGTYTVNTKALDCFLEPGDALDKTIQPFKRLKRGERFIYHGYHVLDDQTLVAIELEQDEPIHCYRLLPEVWTGKSYWDFGETELLTEVLIEAA